MLDPTALPILLTMRLNFKPVMMFDGFTLHTLNINFDFNQKNVQETTARNRK